MNQSAVWHFFWMVMLLVCAVVSTELQACTSGAWRWAYLAALFINSYGAGHELTMLARARRRSPLR